MAESSAEKFRRACVLTEAIRFAKRTQARDPKQSRALHIQKLEAKRVRLQEELRPRLVYDNTESK